MRRRRRRTNPTTRDAVGVAIGLGAPLAVVVLNRAIGGRNLLTGKHPDPAPTLLPGLAPALDPLVYTLGAIVELAITGIGVVATGWKPGLLRGAAIGSGVAAAGGVSLGVYLKSTRQLPPATPTTTP